MNKKDILLGLMIISYLIPISYVYINYSKNHSVSNVIASKNCNNVLFYSMIIMGCFTLLYELERNDFMSMLFIVSLLIGIFGVITIYEDKIQHYFFAGLVLISILGFMFNNCRLINCNLLYLLLYLEIILLLTILINIKKNIFYSEFFFILNFAIYYLYLHFLK